MSIALRPARTRRLEFGVWAFGQELASGRRGPASVLLLAAMLLLGVLTVLLRLPDDARNLIWAEDGTIFLSDAFVKGYGENLFTPYAGYMHLFPRTSAELVSVLPVPPEYLGLAMNMCGAAAWAVVAIAAFVFTRDRIRPSLRWLLWVATLLLPIGGYEVATNVANSHWFLMFGAFLALSARSGGTARTIFASVLVVVAVLSDPLALLFAPIAAVRLACLPGRRESLVPIAFAVAGVVQVLVDLGTSRDRGDPHLDAAVGRLYLIRVVWQTLVGPKDGTAFYYSEGQGLVLAAAAGCIAVLLTLVILRWSRSGLTVMALVGSAGFFAVLLTLSWSIAGIAPAGEALTGNGRYLVVPGLLLLVAVVSAVDQTLPRQRTRLASSLRLALIASLAVALIAPGIGNYQKPAFRAGNQQMGTSIDGAEPQCEAAPDDEVDLPIAPPGWSTTIPCEVLLTP
jgi:hypothetical protein